MNCIKLLCLCFAIWACSGDHHAAQEETTILRGDVPVIDVRTALSKKEFFERLINTSGRVHAAKDVQLMSPTAGMVEKVLVKNAAQVKKDEVILTFNNQMQMLAKEKALVNLKEREIAYQDALLGYRGLDSSRMMDAYDNIKISSGLAAAELAYKEAQLELQNTYLKAPFDGIISDLELTSGTVLTPNQLIGRIHSTDELAIVTEILEADALLLKPGMRADIKSLSGEELCMATVQQINPRVEFHTGMVKVTLAPNKKINLLPGMTTQVTIAVPFDNVITVPREAVVMRNGKQVVFTELNGVAKWNYVTTGRQNGKVVEILTGIKENQNVIVSNNLQLAHDALVRVN